MKHFKRLSSAIVSVVIVFSLVLAWSNRQAIYDWWRLRDYQPPTAIQQLADKTTMTPHARRLFYINRPVIADRAQFNEKCSLEASIVLGCYIPRDGIYLYNINEPRLQGVMEVTAAHEMLHAGYERLDNKERERVDAMTKQAYAQLTNERVRRNVESYQRQDPGVVPNELHSILATEVTNLPPQLEDYYRMYFTNRQSVVALSAQYESEFEGRKAKVDSYDKQLGELKIDIEANKNELALQYKNLESEKTRLEALLASGDVQAYNSAVPTFNEQISRYNEIVKTTDRMINRYNEIVQERNSVALEVQNLAEAIDSRPQSF